MTVESAQRYTVAPVEDASLVLADGTRLDADIYRPVGQGPFPVLLQRQAYSRRIGCTICYAHPSWYAAHGFIVVVQDVRGRGTSDGVFRPGETEIADGAASVEWAAALPGSNGRVGMYGFSYQGYNQMLAAAGDSPSLKAMAPAMAPWDVSGTWMYENGALRMKQAIGWGNQITAEALRRAGDVEGYAALLALNGNPPVNGPVSARPAILEKYRDHSHVFDWLEMAPDDPYWARISPRAYADGIAARDLPMLFIGGWFDTHLSSTIEGWKALGGRHPASRLIVGPWLHFPWVAKQGAIDFGPDAACDMDSEQIAFFRQHLCDDAATHDQAPIRLFDMGTSGWRDLAKWPDDAATLALSGTGRSSIDAADGVLGGDPLAPSLEAIVLDPWRPTPVTGGCYSTPPGPIDRAATDERGDVATFTTAPFENAFVIGGDMVAELAVHCDRSSFDLHCVLSRVDGQGRVYQVSSGYAHFRVASASGLYTVPLTASMATIPAGQSLRLSVAGSAFPAYPVNPGTGGDPAITPRVDALVTTITIAAGEGSGSNLRVGILQA